MSSPLRSPSVLLAALASLLALPAVAASHGQKDFHTAGYPTMMLLIGVFLVGLSVWSGRRRSNEDWLPSSSVLSKPFFFLCLVHAVLGIFLLFGAGSGARVNVLGFQLMVVSAMGFYAAYTHRRAVGWALFVALVATVLCVLGSAPLLNFSVNMADIDYTSCVMYFQSDATRCKDSGYLQLLRTFSMFAVATLLVQTAEVFLALTDGGASMHAADAGASMHGHNARSSLLSGFGNDKYAPPSVSHAHGAPSYDTTAAQQQVPVPVAQAYAGNVMPSADAAKPPAAYQAL